MTAKLGSAAEGSPQAIPYSRRISDMAEDLNGHIDENKRNTCFVILIHDMLDSDRRYVTGSKIKEDLLFVQEFE